MYRKLIFALVLFFAFTRVLFAQTTEPIKKDDIPADVKKAAVAFLRETSLEVNNLHTLENRIGFSAETAGLMWFNDEKESRAMFQTVINDFSQLLSKYDQQMNVYGAPTDPEMYSPDTSERAQIGRKFYKAFAVRQQIAEAIAEHDPELALNFFTSTSAAVTNAEFRKRMEQSDVYFETRLLNQIAENDVDTALKYARKTLDKGFNYETTGLLKKIYDKDAEKGAAFGEEIISKLKSDIAKPEDFYYANRVLDLGAENLEAIKGKTGKRPMFSEQSLRDLAEQMAQQILNRQAGERSDLSGYLGNIEKFAPDRAMQIRQKFNVTTRSENSNRAVAVGSAVPPPPPPPMPSSVKAEQDAQKQLNENIKSLGDKKLSDDERKAVVEQSKKIINETGDRDKKFLALTALAVQVAKAGDKELASELMIQLKNLTNFQPKNYRDFMEVWMLASGYSEVEPEKAFPVLEDAIFRLNDTIAAFVKVGEFIDVSGEMIDDGEIQVGGFGGNITRDILGGLNSSDMTIRNLALDDFTRTKNLANKFDRPEVRILAKILVLRAVLAKDVQKKRDS